MKKKNILFQTAVVACLLFGTGINMSSCIEQTFPKSSTALPLFPIRLQNHQLL